MHLTRRGALGAAAALGLSRALPTQAAAPLLNTQAPPFYRFRIGEFEATVVSDGALPLGKPGDGFPSAPPAELAEVYRRVAPSRHGALERGERFWRRLARRGKDKTMAAFVLDGPAGLEVVAGVDQTLDLTCT